MKVACTGEQGMCSHMGTLHVGTIANWSRIFRASCYSLQELYWQEVTLPLGTIFKLKTFGRQSCLLASGNCPPTLNFNRLNKKRTFLQDDASNFHPLHMSPGALTALDAWSPLSLKNSKSQHLSPPCYWCILPWENLPQCPPHTKKWTVPEPIQREVLPITVNRQLLGAEYFTAAFRRPVKKLLGVLCRQIFIITFSFLLELVKCLRYILTIPNHEYGENRS